MPEKLTQALVRRAMEAHAPGTQLYDSEVAGLRLVVGKTSCSFKHVGRVNDGTGRYVSIIVGRGDEMSLTTARSRSVELRQALARGEDPRTPKSKMPTLEEVLSRYEETRKNDLQPTTLRSYRTHLKPVWKDLANLPMDKMDRDTVRRMHERVTKKNGPSAANHVARVLKLLHNDAARTLDLPPNPISRAVRLNKEHPRQWAISGDDLPKLWRQLDAMEDRVRAACWLLMLTTGLRSGNARAIRWEHLSDDGTLLIPRAKSGRAFRLPLPRLMLQELERVRQETRPLCSPFMFGSPTSKSGHIEQLARTTTFCALQRPVMDRGAPLHAFDAPQASSGKSKLTESHGVLATGAIPSMVTWANNEEENNKRLGAALRRAPQVLVFDNLEAKNGDALQFSHMNTAVTATKVTVRILGKSEDVEMPSLTFFEASGNNIVVVGDMTSRVVKCRIDAKMAHPDKRVFDFDPVERAGLLRGEIVSALLSVLASYIKAGRPVDGRLLPMRFGDAWRAVQGAVVWCGWEDPVKTVDEVRATDEHAAMANEAAELWAEVFGDEWVSTSDLMDYYTDKSSKKDAEGEVLDLSPIFDVIVTSTASASAMSRSLKDGAVFGEYVLRATKRETGRLKEKMVRLVRQE